MKDSRQRIRADYRRIAQDDIQKARMPRRMRRELARRIARINYRAQSAFTDRQVRAWDAMESNRISDLLNRAGLQRVKGMGQ